MISMNSALLTIQDVKNFILEAMQRDQILTRKELMAYFNWNQYNYEENIAKGMPWFGKRTRKQFVLTDVKKWLIDNNML